VGVTEGGAHTFVNTGFEIGADTRNELLLT
jgi:hypothetical protein